MLMRLQKGTNLWSWWLIMVSYRAARVPLQRPGSKACCREGSFSDRKSSVKGSDGGSSDSGGKTCHMPLVMAMVGADRKRPRPLYLQNIHISDKSQGRLRYDKADCEICGLKRSCSMAFEKTANTCHTHKHKKGP